MASFGFGTKASSHRFITRSNSSAPIAQQPVALRGLAAIMAAQPTGEPAAR